VALSATRKPRAQPAAGRCCGRLSLFALPTAPHADSCAGAHPTSCSSGAGPSRCSAGSVRLRSFDPVGRRAHHTSRIDALTNERDGEHPAGAGAPPCRSGDVFEPRTSDAAACAS